MNYLPEMMQGWAKSKDLMDKMPLCKPCYTNILGIKIKHIYELEFRTFKWKNHPSSKTKRLIFGFIFLFVVLYFKSLSLIPSMT